MYVTVSFNPTTEVDTFRLRGWCILGVFLLPAFTRLGHECQDLLSPGDGMHVSTSVCTFKVFRGNGVKTHVYSKGKVPSTVKVCPEGNRTHDAGLRRTASPTHNQRGIQPPPTPTPTPPPRQRFLTNVRWISVSGY